MCASFTRMANERTHPRPRGMVCAWAWAWHVHGHGRGHRRGRGVGVGMVMVMGSPVRITATSRFISTYLPITTTERKKIPTPMP